MREFRIVVPNESGQLARVAQALSDQGVNLKAFTGLEFGSEALLAIVPDDPDRARAALATLGLIVREVELAHAVVADRPGTVAEFTRKLTDAGVNLETTYLMKHENQFHICFTSSDLPALRRALGIP